MRNTLAVFFAVSFFAIFLCCGQNALIFTGIAPTAENAITLHWASNTNELYEIDEANSLDVDTNTGVVDWYDLNDQYPSQGTNTFWLDTGNYRTTPAIPNPKYEPMRFYRVIMTGTNTIATNPVVNITSITNGATVSGALTVSVSASSPDLLYGVSLYVDGQEMNPSLDGTNFVLNTCEWYNGQHTLFAVARSESGLEGPSQGATILYGSAVSPMVKVNFSNLVTEIAFSQQDFEPSLGETQEVTAYFPENSDWTLQIEDINSNVVRTVTGSGNYLDYPWDGTGTGETNIADGIYYYYISAATNGEANEVITYPPETNSPPSPLFSMDSISLYSVNTNTETVVPLIIYPPGFDTNNLTIISATPAEVASLQGESATESGESESVTRYSGGIHPDDSGGSGASQNAPPAPNRTPTIPNKNNLGTYGICYQQWTHSDPETHSPTTGWPYLSGEPYYVALDGNAVVNGYKYFTSATMTKKNADDFAAVMGSHAFSQGFELGDAQVTPNLLQRTSEGGLSIFNAVNFGFFLTHGDYGSAAEDDGVKYTYLWFENFTGANASYLRLSDFDFGGSGSTGLRWMAIESCYTLNETDWNSMNNHYKYPVNSNLHVLLSDNTEIYFCPDLGKNLATYLTVIKETVINSWYDSGSDTYSSEDNGVTNTVNFAYVADANCISDSVYSYYTPEGSLQYNQKTVYTYPP